METLTEHFMARVDAFLERTGVGPTTLGRQGLAIRTWCVSYVLAAPRGWRRPTRSWRSWKASTRAMGAANFLAWLF